MSKKKKKNTSSKNNRQETNNFDEELIVVEWGLVAIAHNLRKYIAYKQADMSKKMLENNFKEGDMNYYRVA